MSDKGHILGALLEFLRDNLFYGSPVPLTPATRVLDEGLLNSTGYIEVIGFLEAEFSVRLPDSDLVPENFSTPEAMADLVCHRLKGA